jgi:hypothetical protein
MNTTWKAVTLKATRRLGDTTKMGLRETGYEYGRKIELPQVHIQWRI